MENPDYRFWIIEDIGNNAPPEQPPRKIYFCRQIVEGQGRVFIDKYSLKRRGYLGTTSMSSEWSLLMANQALSRPGSFIFDPFVGTGAVLSLLASLQSVMTLLNAPAGSILIGCAHFGALTIGGDIDPRVLRGETKLNQQYTGSHARRCWLHLLTCGRWYHEHHDQFCPV